MKIIDKRIKPNMRKFEDIECGECFIDGDGDVNIKVVEYSSDDVFAVCLRNGLQWFPEPCNKYQIISATVTIE